MLERLAGFLVGGVIAGAIAAAGPTTQCSIDRVDLMPNLPQPFKLKDFKSVARGYDRLAFDFDARGPHLPLIWWNDNQTNLPMRTFGMPSYVGKKQAMAGDDHEAITTIGSVLGATVAGIDKSAGQHDWAAMCASYYNTRTGQNVILNNISTETGKTYWYELFPQILFNCLVDRYPGMPRGDEIVHTSADRWHQAFLALRDRPGGLNFDHTAFNLVTMQPVDNGKWHEPDGAAGIAWIQFSAFQKYQDTKYLEAADTLIGYLDRRADNPVYEIVMPYGALVAARLNAEHGKNHDVGRLLNWCFDPSDNRAGWGVIVGNWGGYEVSGLAGSVSDGGGYGFVMNTFAMGGAVVPVARYDERYARAIGKWMLNAVNAVRLCYPDELPPDLQSCPDFRSEPANVIPYEGLRKSRNGKTPYASGDPLVAGWGETDLGLYGGGFVGMFAGIISPTNDPAILQLDLLATDFYRNAAYPSYLFYNPHNGPRSVRLPIGSGGNVDVYDAVRNEYVAKAVAATAGGVDVPLDADSAALVVLVPGGAVITHDGRKTLADGVVIDFDNGRVPRPELPAPPVKVDRSVAVAAARATIAVDGNVADWAGLDSEPIRLTTAGRGKMEMDIRYAWDAEFFYVLAEQRTAAARVHEAQEQAEFAAAVWDFDGVWLHIDLANDRVPSIGDVVLSAALSSRKSKDLFHVPALAEAGGDAVATATSGTAEGGNRVVEVRISWKSLLGHAFNGRSDLVLRFGPIKPGLRIGCEPVILEFNHTGQSFIGGMQYKKPSGFDENSRDVVLKE